MENFQLFVLICTIAIYFIAIIQMSSCMDDLSKAVTAASRVAAIDENLKDAKKDALDIAKYQLKRNSAIKKVSVEITYPVKNEWTSGNYILVTVKAKIKTIAPIKTKIHKKQILVTIEGISGQSIVIPSNVEFWADLTQQTILPGLQGWASIAVRLHNYG